MTSLRLAFMGSPDFAVPALRALHAAGHEVCCVYTQPPRPSGRGHRVKPSPVHQAALDLNLTVRTPRRIRQDTDEHAYFQRLDLDAAVVAAYGLILPREMLSAPRRGCLNLHASLLPRWRGAAPIQAAIMEGDAQTGITIMQMDEGLDTGDMLCSRAIPIRPRDTAQTVHDALADIGAELIVDALEHPKPAVRQPEAGATYAPKLTKLNGHLDWTLSAAELDRRVRALNPWPGTYFLHKGEAIRVLAAEADHDMPGQQPGIVQDGRPRISCGSGSLRLLCLKRPGKDAQEAAAFLRGYDLPAGTALG